MVSIHGLRNPWGRTTLVSGPACSSFVALLSCQCLQYPFPIVREGTPTPSGLREEHRSVSECQKGTHCGLSGSRTLVADTAASVGFPSIEPPLTPRWLDCQDHPDCTNASVSRSFQNRLSLAAKADRVLFRQESRPVSGTVQLAGGQLGRRRFLE